MIRLVLAALCAIALAFSPAAAGVAIAGPAVMSDCTMDGHMPVNSADHSKMDCCTPVCQITVAAAVLPEQKADTAPFKSNGELRNGVAVRELASFTASGPDPPPRLPS